MTVAELRKRLLGCITLAALEVAERTGRSAEEMPDPRFVAAVRALPDTSLIGRLAPEMRLLLEEQLRLCSDAPAPAPAASKPMRSRSDAK